MTLSSIGAKATAGGAKHDVIKEMPSSNSKTKRLISRINKANDTNSMNEEEIADEEKDSFHSRNVAKISHNGDDKKTFNQLSGKLNKVFGTCIDDNDGSYKR